MPTRRNLITVDGGATGRPFVEFVAGSELTLANVAPRRRSYRWTLIMRGPASSAAIANRNAQATVIATSADDDANMLVVRLDVDEGLATHEWDIVVLGAPDARGWVIPAHPTVTPAGLVVPGYSTEVAQDPWNVTWGMRRILNDIRAFMNAPAPSAGGRVLFEWNGADTSQFETPITLDGGTQMSGTISGTMGISVVDGVEGKRLRLDVAGVNQVGVMLAIVKASELPDGGLPRRYVVRYQVLAIQTGGPASCWHGCEFLGNGNLTPGSHYGFSFLTTHSPNNCWGMRYDAGVGKSTGSTPGPSSKPPNMVEVEVQARFPAGDHVTWRMQARSGADAGWGSTGYITIQEWDQRGINGSNWAAYGAAWNDLALPSAGLILQPALVTNPYMELSQFAILKHPLDD